MRADGADIETIARCVHGERRKLAAIYKGLTPEPMRTSLYERSYALYGDRIGPSIEYLRATGKSWWRIAQGAARAGVFGDQDVPS